MYIWKSNRGAGPPPWPPATLGFTLQALVFFCRAVPFALRCVALAQRNKGTRDRERNEEEEEISRSSWGIRSMVAFLGITVSLRYGSVSATSFSSSLNQTTIILSGNEKRGVASHESKIATAISKSNLRAQLIMIIRAEKCTAPRGVADIHIRLHKKENRECVCVCVCFGRGDRWYRHMKRLRPKCHQPGHLHYTEPLRSISLLGGAQLASCWATAFACIPRNQMLSLQQPSPSFQTLCSK